LARIQFSGRRLRELRRARGIKPEALAVAIDRSVSSVALYERSAVIPPGTVLAELATVLGCEVSDLFEASDSERVAS
jgi:transcriptional regulator with XRE-family HTH domain